MTEEDVQKALEPLIMDYFEKEDREEIEQKRAGFQRVYGQMVDISIDGPQAHSVLERWVLRCQHHK
jgi:hypothetical protein